MYRLGAAAGENENRVKAKISENESVISVWRRRNMAKEEEKAEEEENQRERKQSKMAWRRKRRQ
jgi:hypothetical protein